MRWCWFYYCLYTAPFRSFRSCCLWSTCFTFYCKRVIYCCIHISLALVLTWSRPALVLFSPYLFPPGFQIHPDWCDHKRTALSTGGNGLEMHWGHIWDCINLDVAWASCGHSLLGICPGPHWRMAHSNKVYSVSGCMFLFVWNSVVLNKTRGLHVLYN